MGGSGTFPDMLSGMDIRVGCHRESRAPINVAPASCIRHSLKRSIFRLVEERCLANKYDDVRICDWSMTAALEDAAVGNLCS